MAKSAKRPKAAAGGAPAENVVSPFDSPIPFPTIADDGGELKDFDEALAALAPIRWKIKGRQYEIPPDPPVAPMMALYRNALEGKGVGDPVKMLGLLCGEKNVDQMMADGIGPKGLDLLVDWITDKLGMKADPAAQALAAKMVAGGDEGVVPKDNNSPIES